MPSEIYEVLSLAARYWFAFLGVLIVWRAFRWLRKDRRAKHRRLRQLPDAGMVGELVVLSGGGELADGCALPLPREGVLGSLRTCDVTLPAPGVAPRHLDFVFEDGRGLLILPRSRCEASVDGVLLHSHSRSKDAPMHHGSRLQVGDAVLRLRLFVGLETGRTLQPAASDAQGTPAVPSQLPAADWQSTPYIYHQIPADWSDQTGQYAPPSACCIDPETGLPLNVPPVYLDPETGLPLSAPPVYLDPETELPLSAPPVYLDPETGLPLSSFPPPLPIQEDAPPDGHFPPAAARDRTRLHPRRRTHGKN